MHWLIRKVGLAQLLVFAVIAAVASWGLWLPLFAPIISVKTINPHFEGDYFVAEVESFKWLPCAYVGGRAQVNADNATDEPISPVNYFTGAGINNGLLRASQPGEPDQPLPLWYSFQTRVKARLRPAILQQPISTLRMHLILAYRCTSITPDFHQIISIPTKESPHG